MDVGTQTKVWHMVLDGNQIRPKALSPQVLWLRLRLHLYVWSVLKCRRHHHHHHTKCVTYGIIVCVTTLKYIHTKGINRQTQWISQDAGCILWIFLTQFSWKSDTHGIISFYFDAIIFVFSIRDAKYLHLNVFVRHFSCKGNAAIVVMLADECCPI